MNLNKDEKQPKGLSELLKVNSVNVFLLRVIVVWVLIVMAFWLGSGLVSFNLWPEGYRHVMVGVLVGSLLPIVMSVNLGSK